MLRINRDGRSVASCTGEDVVVCDHTLRAGDAGRRFTGAVGTEGERGWTFRPAPLTLEPAT